MAELIGNIFLGYLGIGLFLNICAHLCMAFKRVWIYEELNLKLRYAIPVVSLAIMFLWLPLGALIIYDMCTDS
jgi:hypothetical protein